tara:strand:+ start:223 stop:360 length:138 start_codon:yes stop_codon:yes gene_type:complete
MFICVLSKELVTKSNDASKSNPKGKLQQANSYRLRLKFKMAHQGF